jgi:hypothetical protein
LRHYFPCHPGQCLVVGGCKPSGGCGARGCGQSGQPGLLAPSAAANGYPHQAVPAPVGAVSGQPTARMARPTFPERVMGMFESVWSEPTPFVAYPAQNGSGGPTVVPAPNGHRFAAPGVQQPANGAMIQAGHQQPGANRPLTKQ